MTKENPLGGENSMKTIKSEKGDGNIDIPRVSYSGQRRSNPEVQWNTVSTTARRHWGQITTQAF